MLKRIATFTIFLVLLAQLVSCQKTNLLYVGVAEDLLTKQTNIHELLANGRKLALDNRETSQSKIELIQYDTFNDAENTANAFRDFFISYPKGIMIGTPSAECAHVAKYVANLWGRLFLCDSYQNTIVECVSTTLLINQNPLYQGKLSARFAVGELRKKRLCVVYDSSNPVFTAIKEGISQEGIDIGVTVMEVPFQRNEGMDPNSIFAKTTQANPDIVFLLAAPSEVETLVQTAKNDFQMQTTFALSAYFEPESWGEIWEDTFFLIPFYDKKESFTGTAFYKQYTKMFGKTPEYYSALGFDEITFIRYLQEENTNQNICHAFQELKGKPLPEELFLTGLKQFDRQGLSIKPIDVVQIRNASPQFVKTYWHKITRDDL